MIYRAYIYYHGKDMNRWHEWDFIASKLHSFYLYLSNLQPTDSEAQSCIRALPTIPN